MYSNDKKSSRRYERLDYRWDLSPYLAFENKRPIPALGVDISKNGIGVIVFEEIVESTFVLLKIPNNHITLKVIWCKKDNIRENLFHVGLEVDDQNVDLIELLKEVNIA